MALNKELASVLKDHRAQVAEVFFQSLALTPKWASGIAPHQGDRAEFVSGEVGAWVDYLASYFDKDDATYKQLLIGEKVKAYYSRGQSDELRRNDIAIVQAHELSRLTALLEGVLSPLALGELQVTLDEIRQLLLADSAKKQRILLVGDCLFLDIVPFIVGPLLESGITLVCDYATSKNSIDLRDHLRKFSNEKFDLVFFSPFTYDFSPEYSQLKNWRNFSMGSAQLQQVVQSTLENACATLDIMADLFDCPVYVHNSALILLEESPWKRRVKNLLTSRVRNQARHALNTQLANHIEKKNASAYKHIFVLDEAHLVLSYGEHKAGAYFYKSDLQHPAVFGRVLASQYVDILFVNTHLVKKKLVVCDLDNTLWNGVIGEGAVIHLHDRQKVLKELKAKGVVLAINSKNDPDNVNWEGGTLTDDDFVYANINWEPKVHGMKRMQSELNLKTKDFVFIDDRHDEREMVQAAYSDILCLDATDGKVWQRFALWRDALDDEQETDRTLMYKEREVRKAFVKDGKSTLEDKIALFSSLELKLKISHAQPTDLKRVAELINRTNQFNLEGSRTTLKEVIDWHSKNDYLIVTGQTSDRFGEMGTTCIAVARVQGDAMVLLPFVLSCRVFGYGIEHSIMNYLKLIAAKRGLSHIKGRYLETQQNKPCKDFLAQSGFVQQPDAWLYIVDQNIFSTNEWLQVEHPSI